MRLIWGDYLKLLTCCKTLLYLGCIQGKQELVEALTDHLRRLVPDQTLHSEYNEKHFNERCLQLAIIFLFENSDYVIIFFIELPNYNHEFK